VLLCYGRMNNPLRLKKEGVSACAPPRHTTVQSRMQEAKEWTEIEREIEKVKEMEAEANTYWAMKNIKDPSLSRTRRMN